jgi:hypothetical protein
MLDSVPHIAVDRGERDKVFLSEENITKGSKVRIRSDSDILVFINYDRDEMSSAQGMDLIPGLTPYTPRGLPGLMVIIVAISGLIIAVDMIIITQGGRSIVDIFQKKRKGKENAMEK